MSKVLSFVLIFFLSASLYAQEVLNSNRKKIKTTRITKAPKIDGVLDLSLIHI